MADAFHDDEFDAEEEKFFGMYIGTVVKRDPELRRIKFEIEGFIEPESPWAYPIGSMAGGSANVGAGGVPREKAQVLVWFANGDIERPFYAPAHWGEGEIPEEVADKPDATIWSSENWAIVLDDSEGSNELRIINRKTGDTFEMDAESNSIRIAATTSLVIECLGVVDISGAAVQINGRKVAPIGDPI